MEKIKYSKEVVDFLNTQNCIWTINDIKYYFVPSWFKSTDKENVFEVIDFEEDISGELKDEIHQLKLVSEREDFKGFHSFSPLPINLEYEYLHLCINRNDKKVFIIQDYLNIKGKEGWELAYMEKCNPDIEFIFKRILK